MTTNQTTPTDEEIERVAEALWQAESERAAGRRRLVTWAEISDSDREVWRFMARAAILAMSRPSEN
jgi:hypothetical protein